MTSHDTVRGSRAAPSQACDAADWHGCYTGQTALLTPDSFAHPAKMAPALLFRIFEHLAELGLLKPDDTVLDPMAGTGLTGLAWAAKGGHSVLVELEDRFVLYSMHNVEQLMHRGCNCEREPFSSHLRQLREDIQRLEIIHIESEAQAAEEDVLLSRLSERSKAEAQDANVPNLPEGLPSEPRAVVQGATGGECASVLQLGLLLQDDSGARESSLQKGLVDIEGLQILEDSRLSEGDSRASASDVATTRAPLGFKRGGASYQRRQDGQQTREPTSSQSIGGEPTPQFQQQYPKTPLSEVCPDCGKPIWHVPVVLQGDARRLSELMGERGLKAVTSPPYADAVNSGKPGIDYAKAGRPDRLQESEARHNPMSTGEWAYGSTPGQIGALKDKPLKAVTSPPYGMGTGTGHGGELDRPILTDRKVYQDYNKANPSNIGNLPDKPLVDVSQIKEIAEVCRESFQLSIASIAENHAAGRAARQPVGDVISLSGQELTTANSAATRKVNTAHNAGNLSSTERQYARVAPPGSALWADLLALSIENACANLTKECQGRNIPRQAVLKCLWLSLKDENLKNLLIAAFTELLSGQSGDRQYSPEMPIHAESVATKVQQGITSILSRIISNLLLASLNSSLMSGMESRCAVPATTKQRETEDSGTSYLSAMKVVYEQIARVADVLVVVTKNPTRNGKLRRLDLDTIALLEETGWTLHCHHRAILFTEVEQYEMMRWMHDTPAPKPSPEVTEFLSLLEDDEEAEAKRQSRQDVLDYFAEYDQWEKTGYWGPGGIVKRTMGRLSFFKRLSWQKGNAVARWEDVLVCVRGSQ